jgi:hypothetical protein
VEDLKINITTRADTSGAKQAEQALNGVGDAARKAAGENITFLGKTGQSVQQFGNAAADTSEKMARFNQHAEKAVRIGRGLEQAAEGGTTGFIGMVNVLRGLSGVATTALGIITRFIPVIGGAAGATVLMNQAADQNRKAIERMGAAAAANAERIKAAYKGIEDEAKKSVDAQIAALQRLDTEFAALLDRIEKRDAAVKKSFQLTRDLQSAQLDRDEQKALAGATTDEQRQKISTQFASRREGLKKEGENDELQTLANRAKLQQQLADEQLQQVQEQRDAATLDARTKREAADSAKARAKQAFDEGASDATVTQAQADAKIAAKAAEEAENNLSKVVAETAKAVQRIEALIEEARANAEAAAKGQQIQATQREADALRRENEARPEIEAAQREAEAARDRGDTAGQARAAAKIDALKAGVRAGAGTAPFPTSRGRTAIGGPSEAAPGTFIVNGETRPIVRGGSPTIERDGVKQSLDGAAKSSGSVGQAVKEFAAAVTSQNNDTVKVLKVIQRQQLNAREN